MRAKYRSLDGCSWSLKDGLKEREPELQKYSSSLSQFIVEVLLKIVAEFPADAGHVGKILSPVRILLQTKRFVKPDVPASGERQDI
jgi:hypothetical protein